MLESFWVAEQLAASQEGLSSMKRKQTTIPSQNWSCHVVKESIVIYSEKPTKSIKIFVRGFELLKATAGISHIYHSVVTLLTCIREILGSILGWDSCYPEVFLIFLSPFRILLRLPQHHILLHPFQFIIHQSSHYWKLLNIDTDWGTR
jgi:hypothetical protein